MNVFRNASLQRKQMLIIMSTTSVALLLVCAALTIFEIITFRQEITDNLSAYASITGNNVAAALDFNDTQAAGDTLSSLNAEPDIIGACVYSADGSLFSKYSRKGTVFALPKKVQSSGYTFSKDSLALFQPIMSNGQVIGTIYLESDTKALRSRLAQYLLIMLIVFGVTLAISLVLSHRLQRVISEPILELVRTARQVAKNKNYSIRVNHRSSGEIGVLIDGFNDMLAQVEERDRNLEQHVKERTQELAKSLSILNATLDSTTDGILVVNSERKKILQNRQVIELLKLPQDVAGEASEDRRLEHVANLMKDPEAFLAKVKSLYSDPDARNHDEIELQDGTILERITGPVLGDDRKNYGRIWTFRNVTERKRAEEALAYEKYLLNALLDNSDEKIYFKNIESKFIRCSTSMVVLFGKKKPEDLIGKSDRDFFAGEHAQEAFEDEQKIIRSGEPLIGKVEKETWPDGRVTWVLTTKMPLRDEAGNIAGTFGVSKDITALKEAEEKLTQAHQKLVDASRQAGMAEVATSVLHNVGNVLNSANVSTSLIADKIRHSKVANISKIAELIQTNENNLANFFTNDPKGKQLPSYLSKLAAFLVSEQQDILHEINSLVNNIVHIKEIVAMQQGYAKASGVLELCKTTDLVEDALRMNIGAVNRHNIKVIREFSEVPVVLTDKHKVLQILVNLIRNAKHACDDSGRQDKQIRLKIWNGDGCVKIAVVDNGIGIPPENLTCIFNHGFTTRKEGHGFGLHSGANAAKELGGTLMAFSEGIGRGATFTLELPADQHDAYERQS
jgi:PAS domain S-box-containing protein